MKIRSWLIVVFLALSPLVWGETRYPSRTIPLSSSLYEEIELLYRFDQKALPFSAKPWSTEEALGMLEILSPSDANQALLASAYETLNRFALKQVSDTFSYKLSTTVALEGYVHSNSADFTTTYDWIYSVDERKDPFTFDLQMQYSDSLYFATSVSVGIAAFCDKDGAYAEYDNVGAYYDVNDHASYQTTAYLFQKQTSSNLFTADTEMFADWPRHSQLSLGGPWYMVTLGRGEVSWGNGQTGNLVVSSHIKNHNHFNATFFSNQAALQFLAIFIPDPLGTDVQRIFLGHRLEARLRSWLRVSVTENTMYKGESVILWYMDPTFLYHNLYDDDHLNSIASVEADVALLPALSLHAQLALDQYQLPNESQTAAANAKGVLLNLAYSWKAIEEGYWTATLEYVSTDPSLYRRNKIDFLVPRGLHNNGNPIIVDYLGYPWGSDSKVYSLQLSYLIPKRWEMNLQATILRQGAVTFTEPHNSTIGSEFTGNSTIVGPSPSGTIIDERIIIGWENSYTLWDPFLTFTSSVNCIGKRKYNSITKTANDYTSDLQLVVGLQLVF